MSASRSCGRSRLLEMRRVKMRDSVMERPTIRPSQGEMVASSTIRRLQSGGFQRVKVP